MHMYERMPTGRTKMSNKFRYIPRFAPRQAAVTAFTALLMLAGGSATLPAAPQVQKNFSTPEGAVVALVAAAKSGNMDELLAVFGPGGEDILSSGDEVADRRAREVFLVAMEEGWRLEGEGDTKTLIVGNEEWPAPFPIVKEQSRWRFDTEAGREEVLYRRIGRNELNVIHICMTYAQAQEEYASKGRDGKPAGIYARKPRSEPGRHDGLYWSFEPDEEPSPLGELFARATREGYAANEESGKPRPFHGYFFRLLTEQGEAAPGEAKNYIVDGEMTGGFALLAYPAEYGNSGIMTFMINQDGVVYEKDLGEETAQLATEISKYNPDSTWRQSR